MSFGKTIRELRQEKDLGLRAFAKAIEVSPTFISKLEQGTGPLPGEETICRMADFFGRDHDEFLAMADKIASDVKAIIIRNPAYANFIRENAHITKEQWSALAERNYLWIEKVIPGETVESETRRKADADR